MADDTRPILQSIDAQDLYEAWLLQQYFGIEPGRPLKASAADTGTEKHLMELCRHYKEETSAAGCEIKDIKEHVQQFGKTRSSGPLLNQLGVAAADWRNVYEEKVDEILRAAAWERNKLMLYSILGTGLVAAGLVFAPYVLSFGVVALLAILALGSFRTEEGCGGCLGILLGLSAISALLELINERAVFFDFSIPEFVYFFPVAGGALAILGAWVGFNDRHRFFATERDRLDAYLERHKADLRTNLLFTKTLLVPLLEEQQAAVRAQTRRVNAQLKRGEAVLKDERYSLLDEELQVQLRSSVAAFRKRKEQLLGELGKYLAEIRGFLDKVRANIAAQEKQLTLRMYLADARDALQTSEQEISSSEEQAYLQSEQQQRLSSELDSFIMNGKIRMEMETAELNDVLSEELKLGL